MFESFIIEWPKIMVAAAAGGLVGFLSARLQDFLVRRRRFKALASALRAEVARLRKEFGEPVNVIQDWEAFGRGRGAPAIHPWIERIVLDSADLNPELAARFLTLDTQVNNYGHMFMSLREARSRVYDLTQAKDLATTVPASENPPPQPTDEDLADAEQSFQMLQDVAASIRKDAWQTLERIDDLLVSYASKPPTG